MDQLVLDIMPDDPGHFVAVHFDDRIGDLDLAHARISPWDLGIPAPAGAKLAAL
jgi:hypothetical protein